MARKRVSPNRMELLRLRNELRTAVRGHRMLKDKRDGLMQHFLGLIDRNLELRRQVDDLLAGAASAMAYARAGMQAEMLDEAMQLANESLTIAVHERNIMSVRIPEFELDEFDREGPQGEQRFPYGLASTTGELDLALDALREALPVMLELAALEKEVQLLADEIERTRRRVNSLEHVLIPDYEAQIRDVSMKMEENERANLTRLMKVKDMILEEEIKERRKRLYQASTTNTQKPEQTSL